MHIRMLGVPFNGDGTRPEVENPAQAVRDAELTERLGKRGHSVEDLGDLSIPPFAGVREPETGVLNADAWRTVSDDIAATLRGRLGPDHPFLVLGGDCAIMTGISAALREGQKRAGIVYLDGHADFRWPQDSPSGEPADLVLTALTGRIRGLFPDVTRERPLAPDADILLFGFRDPDRISESAIVTCDSARLSRLGVGRAVNDGLRGFAAGAVPVWIHFDVDVMDPDVMPAVMFPERNGLSAAETTLFLRSVFESLPVLGVSVACYHPARDPDGVGARCIVDVLAASLPVQPERSFRPQGPA